MAPSARSFVLRHTRLGPVPGIDGIRLHLGDEVLPLWHAVQVETRDPEAALPYWAFAWGGGLAIARYLAEHPEAVAPARRGCRLGSGVRQRRLARRGLGGHRHRHRPFAVAAMRLNARANRVRMTAIERDVLDEEPPDADVVLAGDCWYEAGFAARVTPWLRAARDSASTPDRGSRAPVSPDRRPRGGRLLRGPDDDRAEDLDRKDARVYRLRR
jgi:predicted nicotinamide N-methyase